MSNPLYTRLKKTASRLLRDYGMLCKAVRISNKLDPVKGVVDRSVVRGYFVDVVLTRAVVARGDDTAHGERYEAVISNVDEAPFEVETNDFLRFLNEVYTVQEITKIAPDNNNIIYKAKLERTNVITGDDRLWFDSELWDDAKQWKE